jgi:hypothetical protein
MVSSMVLFSNAHAASSLTINASADASGFAGGSISPSGSVSVNYGGSQTFTITANTGFHIADVAVDGVSQGGVSTYDFTNVTTVHSITAKFTINSYTINVTQSANGNINPVNPSTTAVSTVVVNYTGGYSFNITPNSGYYIASITTDAGSVTITSKFSQTVSFSNVSADHAITATFAPYTAPTQTATPTPTSTPSPIPATQTYLKVSPNPVGF